MSHAKLLNKKNAGFTLIELIVSMSVMSLLTFGLSMIYFSCLKTYQNSYWKMPPYDEATVATQEIAQKLQGAMLIDSFGTDWLIAVMPQLDANRDIVLDNDDGDLSMTAGNKLFFYLSDESGSMTTQGNMLWMAVKEAGAEEFVPKKQIAENVHPELNPIDPATGEVRPMFRYWPNADHLWGVEMWITSTTNVHGELRPQTAYSEVYLRNL